jgi:CHAT domain-containing protein
VWKPLDEELKEAKNIYFAPDGELYNIAIESLPYHDGVGYMFDRWNFYRLSSTRELAKIKYHPSETKAALYGGLNYDTDITTIENLQQPFDELYIAQYRSEPDSIGLRARYGTLRGTWAEVQLIDSLYSNLKYPSKVYAHNIGTETSLKKLDGQKVSNLHIATHGFYWTETELNEKEDLRELPFMRDNNRPRFVEDKAMTRSGLLFAGANKVLSGKTIPEGYDDGILTAKEISTLDLRGLDLLVLSACQTGLGEIKGDGVYGLQRGFKMADAQTIVMSLWKVDDDATQLLMTEFYKRYLSGQSKHDAFLAAQEAVRNFKGKIRGKDRNFSDPKYWAGFVMLD